MNDFAAIIFSRYYTLISPLSLKASIFENNSYSLYSSFGNYNLVVYRAESYLLRAQRPELAVKFYRDAGMWQDVLRVAKEYLPHKLPQLQDEYERDMMEKSTRYYLS